MSWDLGEPSALLEEVGRRGVGTLRAALMPGSLPASVSFRGRSRGSPKGGIHACDGNCEGDGVSTLPQHVDWLALKSGALEFYSNDVTDPKFVYFQNAGNTFGVDETP